MMSILGEMVFDQGIYSIDESFFDMTDVASYMPLRSLAIR
ncbi:MAG: hypothetical protein K0S95_2029 [Pantoea eucrina]|nr:hypothetical protein [Pantoea eucrina]